MSVYVKISTPGPPVLDRPLYFAMNSEPVPAQRFNILLIDDNHGDAQLFQTAMQEVAPRVSIYWLATAAEGLEALARRERFKHVAGFDIAVLDLNMSPSDGFETIQAMRNEEKSAFIPIVVMSNSRDQSDINRAYRCGANSYIVKPMTLQGTLDAAAAMARYWLEIASLPRE